MRKEFPKLLLAGCITWGVSALCLGQNEAPPAVNTKSQELIWPADKLTFKEIMPGVSEAVLWGDPAAGAHDVFTRFSPGATHPLHFHSSDLKIVVISGHYDYGTEQGKMSFGAGSYLLIPGGRKHTSGSKDGVLFFEESTGKFDYVPVK